MALRTLTGASFLVFSACTAVYNVEPPPAERLGEVPETLAGFWRVDSDEPGLVVEVTGGADGRIAQIAPWIDPADPRHRQEAALRCGTFGASDVCVAGPGEGLLSFFAINPTVTPEGAPWGLARWSFDEDGTLAVHVLDVKALQTRFGDEAVLNVDKSVYVVDAAPEALAAALDEGAVFEVVAQRFVRVTEAELGVLLSGTSATELSELDRLIARLDHASDKMRFAAARELEQMGAEAGPALPRLIEIVDDFNRLWPDPPGRTAYAAASALGAIGSASPEVIDVLRQMRDGPGADDAEARETATRALARIGY